MTQTASLAGITVKGGVKVVGVDVNALLPITVIIEDGGGSGGRFLVYPWKDLTYLQTSHEITQHNFPEWEHVQIAAHIKAFYDDAILNGNRKTVVMVATS